MIPTNRGTSPQVQIVVLAAGLSSRLGRSKALVHVRGVSLLRRTIDMLAPLSPRRILVVSPPRNHRFRTELGGMAVTLIVNRRRSLGLSTSVRCAIVHARTAAAVLLLPVDLVRLQRRDVARLIHAWRAARRRVTARAIGVVAGTPLILPKGVFARAIAIEGDLGLRDFVRNLPHEQVRLVRMVSAQSDVDTPLDLESARRHRGTGAGYGVHQPR